jgi:hypothetical protein
MDAMKSMKDKRMERAKKYGLVTKEIIDEKKKERMKRFGNTSGDD